MNVRDILQDNPGARDGAPRLVCPGCGCEQTHIDGHRVTPWGDDYAPKGSDDATWIWARGGAVILEGWCENSCRFEVALAQHKGDTYLLARSRPAEPVWTVHP